MGGTQGFVARTWRTPTPQLRWHCRRGARYRERANNLRSNTHSKAKRYIVMLQEHNIFWHCSHCIAFCRLLESWDGRRSADGVLVAAKLRRVAMIDKR